MSYLYSGDKVRLDKGLVLWAIAEATAFWEKYCGNAQKGFLLVIPGGIVRYDTELPEAKLCVPRTLCVPVATILARKDASVSPLPLAVAMGERADLMADVWEELWNSGAEEVEGLGAEEVEGLGSKVEKEVIVGGDPAAFERDPDAPEDGGATFAVVAPCEGLLEVSGEFGPRKLAEAEGRACAEELLRVGSPEDVRKRAIAPCPYPLGSAARVWWCWGLNQVVKAAEEAALGDALVERYKNS